MSYYSSLGNTTSNTHLRTPQNVSEFSGMCSVCTSNCTGTCEIGLSAVRGSEAIYPYMTDINQFASDKKYPLDFSHLNINGRVFDAYGIEADTDKATYPNVNLETTFGKFHKVALKAPLIFPAMAKLNWRDYFAGAALAGVVVVVGEDVVAKDPKLVLENGKVVESPLLEEMVMAFRRYHKGYGDIIVQANEDDERLGVLEFAINKLKVESVELKFGQAAKGIQGLGRVKTLEEALRLHKMGYLIFPDPTDQTVVKQFKSGIGPTFEKVGKLPMWDETHLLKRVKALKAMGAKRVCFKTGPFDPENLLHMIKIASVAEVDLITFDGAGGGTGNSPVKMMNEWGIPTIQLESMVYRMMDHLKAKGFELPQVCITGGLSMEDQVFKALALGAPYVGLVGIGRAAMAAAMSGKVIGELIAEGNVPKSLAQFGNTVNQIFENHKVLKADYGDEVDEMSTGAIGLYSYTERVTTGLKQLMALNRKFTLAHISREDVYPLTEIAAKSTQLPSIEDRLEDVLNRENER